ncbi:MFS transporter [Ethanoligenens harbinense]|uniref:Major facilitator superfamily MFS_1 n=1 Tax=Ethanoligenens harbinense (strain DSM 18485 / JCM 12961 / CGMCC 1.5033 / YUAN-3) TaxID=663278 RepID=E6U4H6_ETHHY|nr:MFS transporter [Ethanoligenens harbinense]ADU27783.1 major facilitator superfamily MFS_1 [Ethanoligenens harbinense YUAN-3]
MRKSGFTKAQVWFLVVMGLVMGLRELSMTMLNPFISLYGGTLRGSTSLLCGLALGIYGLTNAVFQIPYGSWSDRAGRKPVILTGLAQLGAGLFLAFLAKDIYLLIAARALQGSGAVMAIAYSWIGDRIENERKSTAMGVAGTIVSIGAVIAFVVGPLLYRSVSVRSMFLGCAVLIALAFLMVLFLAKEQRERKSTAGVRLRKQIGQLLAQRPVLLLSIGGFIINYLNADLFMIVPERLAGMIGAGNIWMVFLPAVVCGIAAMKFSTSLSDKGGYVPVSRVSFAALLLAWLLMIPGGLAFTAAGTIVSLTGFMCLTAGIPSEMNKLVSLENRGAANGILQTMTFLGFFFGPTAAGLCIQFHLGALLYGSAVFLAVVGIGISGLRPRP